MGNAVWLFFALPDWYFSTISAPFGAGALSAIPAIGIIGLVVGTVWGVIKRRIVLLTYVLLPAASQAFVVVAGFMRGSLRDEFIEPITWGFLLLQVATAGYFIFRQEGARLPGVALAIFTSSYAYFATFVATMAFSDVWL